MMNIYKAYQGFIINSFLYTTNKFIIHYINLQIISYTLQYIIIEKYCTLLINNQQFF